MKNIFTFFKSTGPLCGSSKKTAQRSFASGSVKCQDELKYRMFLDITKEAVLINQDNTITYVNQSALKLFGAESPEQIFAIKPIDLFHVDYHKIIEERIEVSLKGEKTPTIEEKIVRLDGTVIDVEVAATSFVFEGKTGIQLGLRDITKRKKADEALRKALEKSEHSDKLKTAFLNNLSHEIRTPLNSIVGFSAFMSEPGQTPEELSHYAEIIQSGSDQLLEVIEDIINISIIETGQVEVHESKTEICRLIKNVCSRFTERARIKGIDLAFSSDLGMGNCMVLTDGGKLIQVLEHLVDNAVKFTDVGRVGIDCSVKDEWLQICVSDTGISIDPSIGDMLYERFYQCESDITKKRGGLGVGLPIARSFTEAMGGRIWHEPGKGSGTDFYVSIPWKPVCEMKTQMVVEHNDESDIRKVLVAEDEKCNFLLLKEVLASLDVTVLHAWNGEQAVKMARQHTDIALVLMDIKMPVMGGYEATAFIKELRPELPVIALTAHAIQGDREKALNSGCDEYMSKPYSIKSLVSLIEGYLGQPKDIAV